MIGILTNTPTLSQLRDIESQLETRWNELVVRVPAIDRLFKAALETYDFSVVFPDNETVNAATVHYRARLGLLNVSYWVNEPYVVQQLERNAYGLIAASMLTVIQYPAWTEGEEVDPIEWLTCFTATFAYETYVLETPGQPYDLESHRAEYRAVMAELQLPDVCVEYLSEIMEHELAIAEFEETQATLH